MICRSTSPALTGASCVCPDRGLNLQPWPVGVTLSPSCLARPSLGCCEMVSQDERRAGGHGVSLCYFSRLHVTLQLRDILSFITPTPKRENSGPRGRKGALAWLRKR